MKGLGWFGELSQLGLGPCRIRVAFLFSYPYAIYSNINSNFNSHIKTPINPNEKSNFSH
jgi:hypothetical protein